METKDILGLSLLGAATLASIGVASLWQKAREVMLFSLVAGTVLAEKVDINFFSHYWYRGSTRGFEFTLLDALAIGLLVSAWWAPREPHQRCCWPGSLGILILYFLYACFSVAISEPKVFGLFELSKIFRSTIVFVAAAWVVRGEKELGILVCGFGCAICFEGALSVKQHFLDGVYRVTGSLNHPNSLSVYLCTVSPIFVAAATSNLPKYVRWFCAACIPVAMVTTLLTVSRAGIPIFALVMLGTTVLCVSWKLSFQKIAAVLAVSAGVAGFAFLSWDRLKARFAETTLEQEYSADHWEGRGSFLFQAKAIVEDRFWGVGLNNWSYWVSKKYGPRLGHRYEDYDDFTNPPAGQELPEYTYAAPAHNLAALTMGELGVPGLIVFLLLWLRWFQMGASFLWERSNNAMRRVGIGFFFAICGIFLQNLFEWVYRQTQILFAFSIVLGALASLYQLKRQSKKVPASRRFENSEAVQELEPAVVGNG
jgi:hypothetical protein